MKSLPQESNPYPSTEKARDAPTPAFGVRSSIIPKGTLAYSATRSSRLTLAAWMSRSVGVRYSFPVWPFTITAVIRAPKRPDRPWARNSAILVTDPQLGHSAPAELIVPSPSVRSCCRFCAAEPGPGGTSVSTPKSTRPSSRRVVVRRIRLPGFLHNQRVFSSGILDLHPPHSAVRAHR